YFTMRYYPIPVRLGVLALTMLTAILVVPGSSQSQTQKPPAAQSVKQVEQKPPALRVLTRLVQISVIAQDGSGNPVMGLTKDDFTITDSGQPQKINYFAEQSSDNLTLTAS